MQLTILTSYYHGWRDHYQIENVNVMYLMLQKYLKIPHKMALLTDLDTTGLMEGIDVYPATKSPEGLKLLSKPNCFARLRYFDPEYTRQFGTEWVMSIDLDVLIRHEITDLVQMGLDHPNGFMINRARWPDRKPKQRKYNGSMYMIKVGCQRQVWDNFDGIESPRQIAKLRMIGSDQAWIDLQAPGAPTWSVEHGVYFWGQYNAANRKQRVEPRIVHFPGGAKPWMKPVRFKNPGFFAEYKSWLDKARSSPTTLSASKAAAS